MKKTIYFHIGIHKTGTTSIQSFLYNNRDILFKKYNTLYPGSILFGNNHNKLAWQFLTIPEYKQYMADNNINGLLCDEIQSSPAQKIIMSAEDLCLIKNPGKLTSLFSDYTVKVILFLRRQDKFLNSVYNQDVKSQEFQRTGEIDDLLKEDKFQYVMDFHSLCSNWENSFGFDNINVRIFDKELYKENTLYRTILEILGINDITEFSLPVTKENLSLTKEAICFLREINTLHLSPDKRYYILDYLEKKYTEQGTANFINPSLFTVLKERYREGNKKLYERYIIDNKNDPYFYFEDTDESQDFTSGTEKPGKRKILTEYYIPVIDMLAKKIIERKNLCNDNTQWIQELKAKLKEAG